MASTTIKVFRYDPSVDSEPYYKTYEVPWKEYLTVLQAIHYVNEEIEPIAFDYSCRGSLCGRCSCMVDGVPALACFKVLAADKEYLIEPLKGFPILKDICVDKSPLMNRFEQYALFVNSVASMKVEDLPRIPYDYYWETLERLNMCRECGNCLSACPVYQSDPTSFAGAPIFAQLALRAHDGLDQRDRVFDAVMAGILKCQLCGKCNEVCPSYIDHVAHHKEFQEKSKRLSPAAQEKNVVVVGGGPAGLEAAWLSAARGHKVTLFEMSDKLGGQYLPASGAPGKHRFLEAIQHYEEMCNKYGVKIQLGSCVDENMVIGLNPDEVILATGAEPIDCPVPIKGDVNIIQANEVLCGGPVGNRALIVGGGMVGIETAEYLASQGKEATIVEMRDEIGADVVVGSKYATMKTLRGSGVTVITNAKVTEIGSDAVKCLQSDSEVELTGFDTIIMAIGSKAYNPLEEKLKGKVKSLHVIGDAVKARKGIQAIDEATVLALKI